MSFGTRHSDDVFQPPGISTLVAMIEKWVGRCECVSELVISAHGGSGAMDLDGSGRIDENTDLNPGLLLASESEWTNESNLLDRLAAKLCQDATITLGGCAFVGDGDGRANPWGWGMARLLTQAISRRTGGTVRLRASPWLLRTGTINIEDFGTEDAPIYVPVLDDRFYAERGEPVPGSPGFSRQPEDPSTRRYWPIRPEDWTTFQSAKGSRAKDVSSVEM